LYLPVKYLSDVEPLEHTPGGDWVDVRAAMDVPLNMGFQLIPLGFAMELPDGYEAHIVPRSSTFKNFGIIQTNGTGVIDNTYCGNNDEWFLPTFQVKANAFVIPKGARIAQYRIIKKQPILDFITVKCLSKPDRGGHGSTGVL